MLFIYGVIRRMWSRVVNLVIRVLIVFCLLRILWCSSMVIIFVRFRRVFIFVRFSIGSCCLRMVLWLSICWVMFVFWLFFFGWGFCLYLFLVCWFIRVF